ncbi:MAG: adenylyl-sulfate kinase [Magnetococcales bacterium]|nr:adenylyl-sulfate kinase [Magnetococcales bacterium]NGZ26678.1 adenylyl-sulfate kinase [Magnetococcales bacterium]
MSETTEKAKSSNVVWHCPAITRELRCQLNNHNSVVLWFTGLSGSGKSTIAHGVEDQLYQRQYRTYVLDGDNVRHGLCGDLGFSNQDRQENIRRIGEVARLFVDAGMVVLTAFISPFRQDRARVREILGEGNFYEIYCRCSLEVCEERDVKGLYKKARQGLVKEFTGISSPYEAPESPELILDTDQLTIAECVEKVIALLDKTGS